MTSNLDAQHAMFQYTKTLQKYKKQKLSIQSFSDGLIFATILRSATNFKLKVSDLTQNCQKWTFKLTNLKKIVAVIQEYFQQQIKKGIKTKDVDLIQISKQNNVDETLKLFEVVIAVLTEAPNKQDHINTIMLLDQRSQGSFVNIIQNLLQNRILDKNENKQETLIQAINYLQLQNIELRKQVDILIKQNFLLDKQIQQLKLVNSDYLQQINRLRDQQIDKSSIIRQQPKEKEYLRNMVDNLRQKLIATVRESQTKISMLKQQIHLLQEKCSKFQQIQQQMEQYKKKYNQTVQNYGKVKLFQRQKSKLTRIIEEKQDMIKKLTVKLDQVNELNFAMQQKQVYTKMQLEKRDVRYKELQKEVKKKYGSNFTQIPTSSKSLQLSGNNGAVLSQQINQIDRQQLQQLKNQVEQLKKKNRQSERQNNRLKRNIQKISAVQNDKKKLERIILDLSNEKRQQIQMLLSTTFQLFNQNQRLKNVLKTNEVVF